jgi:hypothetical protein
MLKIIRFEEALMDPDDPDKHLDPYEAAWDEAYQAQLDEEAKARTWASLCPACKGYPDQEHTCPEWSQPPSG